MKSMTRISFETRLFKQFKRLKTGVVVDIGAGDSPYKDKIPHTKYYTVDSKGDPDYLYDARKLPIKTRTVDTVICTEMLEHVKDPKKIVREIYRILKPSGICILTTRFIQPYHEDPKDYYRFTWDSLQDIFKQFRVVEIYSHGNRFQTIWHLITCGKLGKVLNVINPLFNKVDYGDSYMLGFVVYAKKGR